jgi:integrase/recombinase XerD
MASRFSDVPPSKRLVAGSIPAGGAKATVHSYVRAINTFLAWAKDSGETVGAKAQRPKLERRILAVLTRPEIEAMEDAAALERDKLIVPTLADSGIRLGELLKLTPDDILTEGRRHFLRVQGKGSRDRKVPVFPTLSQRLKRHGRHTRRESSSTRLFLTQKRSPRTGEYAALADSGVQQMIRLLALEAGITKRVYPHLFRYSFITWQLESGLNPILLSRIVGHESLTMINQVYAHVTMDSAYDALMKALLAE